MWFVCICTQRTTFWTVTAPEKRPKSCRWTNCTQASHKCTGLQNQTRMEKGEGAWGGGTQNRAEEKRVLISRMNTATTTAPLGVTDKRAHLLNKWKLTRVYKKQQPKCAAWLNWRRKKINQSQSSGRDINVHNMSMKWYTSYKLYVLQNRAHNDKRKKSTSTSIRLVHFDSNTDWESTNNSVKEKTKPNQYGICMINCKNKLWAAPHPHPQVKTAAGIKRILNHSKSIHIVLFWQS